MGLFGEDKEFSINLFNKEFEYLFNSNKVNAVLIRIPNQVQAPGTYTGWKTTDESKEVGNRTEIEISIHSSKKNRWKLEKEGYIQAGEVLYSAIMKVGVNLMKDNTIEFTNGKRFRVADIDQSQLGYDDSFVRFDIISTSKE